MKTEDLEDMFAQARTAAPLPTSDLMARVLADALAAQPVDRPILPTVARKPPRQGFWSMVLAGLGGRAGIAGLGTATLAGLWIGFAAPAPLADLSAALGQSSALDLPMERVDLMASYDSFLIGG